MSVLSTSGIVNTVTTIVGIIQKLEPAVAMLPEVKALIEAAISTFSNEDQQTVIAAYKKQIGVTDLAHGQTQEALQQAAHADEPENESAKGGAV